MRVWQSNFESFTSICTLPFHIPHHRIISCHLVMPGAIGRHDAVLFLQLLSNSARCISGVCAAKRCRVSKQRRCDVATYKFCREIILHRRLGPRVRAAARWAFGPFPQRKGPRRGQRRLPRLSADSKWESLQSLGQKSKIFVWCACHRQASYFDPQRVAPALSTREPWAF